MIKKFIHFKHSHQYSKIIKVATPLIVANLAIGLLGWMDRVFVSWFSELAVAAAMPAGTLAYTVSTLFYGIASFTSVFISQYYGAKQKDKIGKVIWHGMYFSLLAIPLVPIFWSISPHLFALFSEQQNLIQAESDYFRILLLGLFPSALSMCWAGFFSGTGRTKVILWANTLMCLSNGVLCWVWVFGHWGFRAYGLNGAGMATAVSQCIPALIYGLFILKKEERFEYKTLSSFQFDFHFMKRFFKFGIPAGIHQFLDVIAFTYFMLAIGHLSAGIIAASNITFQIYLVGFMPMVGVGIAISILVGQSLGANEENEAQEIVKAASEMGLVYVILLSLSYLIVPMLYIYPFIVGEAQNAHIPIEMIQNLLVFVAIFTLFDFFQVLYASTLKGAGDTAFVMKVLGVGAIGIFIPILAFMKYFTKSDIYDYWFVMTVGMCALALSFWYRVRQGKWTQIRVIEQQSSPE